MLIVTSWPNAYRMYSSIDVPKNEDQDSNPDDRTQQIRSYDDGFRLNDNSILGMMQEYEDATANHIQPIFPPLVSQQSDDTNSDALAAESCSWKTW